MTIDDTTLSAALHELASTVPDDPGRLTRVHHLARRRHYRHRAIGAGALAATMAAVVVGADAFVSSERGGGPSIAPAAGPGPATPLAACPPVLPAPDAPSSPVGPPAIGEQFNAGGVIAQVGSDSVTVTVAVGPLQGASPVLAVTPATSILLAPPTPDAPDAASTLAQLHAGQPVKFSATRTGTSTYVLDEIHAGPSTSSAVSSGSVAAIKAAAAQPPGPPAIGRPFKVAGVVLSTGAGSVTLQVDRGDLSGTVTFTLTCAPAASLVGDTVAVVGTRTGAATYAATHLEIAKAPVTP